MMAWVGFDRAVRTAEKLGLPGPIDRWRQARDDIHAQVCDEGYDADTAHVHPGLRLDGARRVAAHDADRSGSSPPTDERIVGTVAAIERELLHDGFVLRYRSDERRRRPARRARACSCRARSGSPTTTRMQGRHDEARVLFERLARARATTSGCSPRSTTRSARRQLGNFPQAFTHMGFVQSATQPVRRAGWSRSRTASSSWSAATTPSLPASSPQRRPWSVDDPRRHVPTRRGRVSR